MLLGFCMDSRDERAFENVLPFDEIEGQKGEILAKLLEIVENLRKMQKALSKPRKPRKWKKIVTE